LLQQLYRLKPKARDRSLRFKQVAGKRIGLLYKINIGICIPGASIIVAFGTESVASCTLLFLPSTRASKLLSEIGSDQAFDVGLQYAAIAESRSGRNMLEREQRNIAAQGIDLAYLCSKSFAPFR
jgi:hypothetical protein